MNITKGLLLIDDREDFKNSFKIEAQRNGYAIIWKKSLEGLKKVLPEIHNKIECVILDIKCLKTDDQEIEHENFLSSAISFLDREYNDLPRLILSGDEKAFEQFKDIFAEEKTFSKDPDGINSLFKELENIHQNHESRIKSKELKELEELLKEDEGKNLEFKSTLQYDRNNRNKNVAIRKKILKNIAAFLNTEGGKIIIGIEDDKTISGLEENDFSILTKPNKKDAFLCLFDEIIQENLGSEVQTHIEKLKFLTIEDKTVCIISIKGKFYKPVYFEDKLYIRAQASVREIVNEEREKFALYFDHV